MRCWNCHRELPENAKVCPRCEADAGPGPSQEEMDMAQAMLEQMSPEALAELHQAIQECDTAEEFVDRIMVGDCPTCGSSKTSHCENDPEINELLVGRCYACGQLFCTECEKLLKLGATTCECWDEEPDV